MRVAAATRLMPVAFWMIGTVRLARGLASMMYSAPSWMTNWMLISPRMPSSRAIASVTSTMRRLHRVVDRLRRIDADRVAGVDAGALDVLEDAGNQDVVAVEDGVDLDLQPAQVLVDEQRRVGQDRRRRLRVRGELAFVVDDLHPASAEHERRAHEHREAEFARDRARFAEASRRRPCGRATPSRASAASNFSRSSAMSSDAPVAADDRHAAARQLVGEIDRRLSAEREHHAARAGRA